MQMHMGMRSETYRLACGLVKAVIFVKAVLKMENFLFSLLVFDIIIIMIELNCYMKV